MKTRIEKAYYFAGKTLAETVFAPDYYTGAWEVHVPGWCIVVPSFEAAEQVAASALKEGYWPIDLCKHSPR